MAGALPPVLIELKAITTEFTAKMAEAKGELGTLEADGSKHLSGLAGAGKVAAVGIGVAFAGAAAVSVKAGLEYQSTLATVQGAAGLTSAQVAKIGDTFLSTMGKSTFSAQEMAAAFAPVAGVVKQVDHGSLTAGQSMEFMKAAMDASEATGNSLTNTTHDLSQVLLSYGLSTKDAGEASNELYNVSRTTGVGLDQLSTVVDKLHGRLGIAAPSLADTGALMIDLGEHGISGSRGVMVAQTALTTLLGGSKATSDELKTLGVNVFDSSGKFIGMQGVLQQLTPKLAGMSDQQRIAAERALFGATAGQAMNSTILAGAGALDQAKAATEAKNAVDKAAEAQANTLHGQLHMVAATAEDLAIKFGQLLIPVIQRVISVIASIVGWLDQHKTVALILAGVIGGVLVASIVAWVASLFAADGALAATAIAVGGVEIAMGPLILILAAVIAVALLLVTHWKEVWGAIKDAVSVAWNDVIKPVVDLMKMEFQALVAVAQAMWHGIVAAWDAIKNAISTAVSFVINFVKSNWPLLLAILTGPFGLVVGLIIKYWDQIKQGISDALAFIGTLIGTAMAGIEAAWSAVWTAIKTVATTIWDAIKTLITTEVDAVKAVISATLTAIQAVWSVVWDAVKTAASAVWDAIKTLVTTDINAVKTVVTTVLDAIKALWTTAWNAIKTVVTTIWGAIKTVIGDAIHAVSSTVESVIHGLASTWSSVWNAIKSVASTVVNGIKTIIHGIETGAIDPLKAVVEGFGAAWSAIWNGVASVVQAVWNTIKPIIDTIKSAVGGIVGAVHDVGSAMGAIGHGIGSALGAIGLDTGGPVPGPVGKAIPAVVHGGEYMLSYGMLQGREKIAPAVVNAVISNAATVAPLPGGGASMAGGAGMGGGSGLTVMQPITVNVTGQDAADPNAIAMQVKRAISANNAELVRHLTAARGR